MRLRVRYNLRITAYHLRVGGKNHKIRTCHQSLETPFSEHQIHLLSHKQKKKIKKKKVIRWHFCFYCLPSHLQWKAELFSAKPVVYRRSAAAELMAFNIDHHWNSRKVSTVTDGFVPSDQDWQSWVWGGKRFGSTNRKRKTTVSKSSWSPSENIGGTDPKQTCQWFFFFHKKIPKIP